MTKLSDEFLYHLSRQENLHPKIAEVLGEHAHFEVLKELASNESTPSHVIERLTKPHSMVPDHVRSEIPEAIAMNINAPTHVLHKILHRDDVNDYAKSMAAIHHNTHPDETHRFYQSVVDKSPRLSFKDGGDRRDGYYIGPLVHKSYHPETIDLIHEIVKKHNPLGVLDRVGIAEHPNTSHGTLKELRTWSREVTHRLPNTVPELNKALNKRGIT